MIHRPGAPKVCFAGAMMQNGLEMTQSKYCHIAFERIVEILIVWVGHGGL